MGSIPSAIRRQYGALPPGESASGPVPGPEVGETVSQPAHRRGVQRRLNETAAIMAFLLFLLTLLVEALIIVALLIWLSLLTLRATGHLGPRRGRWSMRTGQDELGERHPLNR